MAAEEVIVSEKNINESIYRYPMKFIWICSIYESESEALSNFEFWEIRIMVDRMLCVH